MLCVLNKNTGRELENGAELELGFLAYNMTRAINLAGVKALIETIN